MTHKEHDNKFDYKQIKKKNVWKDFSAWRKVEILVLSVHNEQINN